MAQGFLKSFNNRLEVHSAGTDPASQVSSKAVRVMEEAGIDLSQHIPVHVDKFLNDEWDYVITVCDNAKETCPVFTGKVINRLHMSFEDPSLITGTEEYVLNEFRRIRGKIKDRFLKFYKSKIKSRL
jgi:arsenate reductase